MLNVKAFDVGADLLREKIELSQFTLPHLSLF
jgi:hypothetical protein